MILKRSVYLFIFFVGAFKPFSLNAQSTGELAISGFVGGSYLPGSADHLSAPYYDDLRVGVNFGGQAILFFGNIGVGFNYSQSNFSASGEEISFYVIDENYKLKFFGPVLASRIVINRSNQLIFTFSFGKSVIQNDAVIDGDVFSFEDDEYVPRLAITYNYKFSDFAFNAGIQFINEKEPLRQSLIGTIGLGPTSFQYRSGTNFDRLSLSIGMSYYISNLF